MREIGRKESEEPKKDMSEEDYRGYLEGLISRVLQESFPLFRNITFRREFSINIQLANVCLL